MAEALPLFPLGTVLFPGMLIPLHVFEPRYRVLVRRCLERERPFGISLIRSGTEIGAGAEPHEVGTSAAIVGHTPLPDGRSFIVVRGGRRFRIRSLDRESEPYLVGEVDWIEDPEDGDARELADRAADGFAEYLHAILAATNEPHADAPDMADLRRGPPTEVSYRVASALAIDASERQRLLEAATAAERLSSEIRLLQRENGLLKELLVRIRARGDSPRLN